MATNPNRKSKPVKKNDSMNGAMDFFIAGCLAELYLLLLRRYYAEGTAVQQIAWYDRYLKLFIGGGAVVLRVGGHIRNLLLKAVEQGIHAGEVAGLRINALAELFEVRPHTHIVFVDNGEGLAQGFHSPEAFQKLFGL